MTAVAIAQMKPELMDVSSNVDKTLSMISDASKNGAELIVFPELTLTGCSLTREEARLVSESLSGDPVSKIINHCEKFNILALVGLIERAPEGELFNSAILIGSQGIISHYRKTHLPALGVDRFLNAGKVYSPPVDTEAGRLGLLICWDIFFPENARTLALSGAQVILVPTDWLASNDPSLEFYRVRAVENGVYVIWANRVGVERGLKFMGRSGVSNPDGVVMKRGSMECEEIIYVDLDLEKVHKGKLSEDYEMNILEERRPELYGKLTET